jgi:hypothetical protein
LPNPGETDFELVEKPAIFSNLIVDRPSHCNERREEIGEVIDCDNFAHYFCHETQAIY